MTPTSGTPPELLLLRRKTRDRALVLPLVGLLLLLPPIAGIFELNLRIAAVPVAAIYLFGVWATLIVCTAALSLRLKHDDEPRPGNTSGEDAT